ncbi:MAG: recombinase family protein [Candidatus Absconditabacteria bacterium]|nr:recombinase family protein [Candidatus Absconditabacteria bacterium]
MKKKYFLYTRVSNDEYEKSIGNQKDILEKIAREKTIFEQIVTPYYEEHRGGSVAGDRPLFEDMIGKLENDMKEAGKSVDKRKYGGILFFKIDRLARNDKDFERLLRLLDAGYEFISATETIENTPTGRLLFRMLSSFAVYESEKLSNRQSIAKIHNLILQKFDSLGGDMIIFGYELDKDKKVQINTKQSNIISRAYDLFIESNGKISYKNLFEKLNKESNGELIKYIKEKGKTTPEKFIRNIIINETAFQYNGYIEINIGVNDELIKNYIDTVTEKKYDKYGFVIEGDCKIGGKVKFVYFLDELMIIPDFIYKEKEIIIKQREFERKPIDGKKALFEGILYIKNNSELYEFSGKPEQKKGLYNNYRRKVGDETFNISEKKIDDTIINSKKVPVILHNLQSHLVEIKNLLLAGNKVNISKELKKLTVTNNLYKGAKDRYASLLEMTNGDIEQNTKLFKRYSDLEKSVNDKLHSLEQDSIYEIEKYLEIMRIEDLGNQSSLMKRLVYISLFEKIAYEPLEKDKFRIILYPFTFLSEFLGLANEIVI